jgi:hypothetical protein
MSDPKRPPEGGEHPHYVPTPPVDHKPKPGGRRQTKRGKRAVDELLPGAGQPMPPQLAKALQHQDRSTWDYSRVHDNLAREQVKIPERLANGVEVALTHNQREMLGMVLAGCTVTDIARRFDMTIPAVRALLSGRTMPHVREAFRLLLEGSGISAPALVAKAHELLGATRAQWNPHTKEWNHFPDYGAQLGAWRVLIQILGFMPARLASTQGAAPAVHIHTNLAGGKGGEAPESERAFVITVEGGHPDAQDAGKTLDVEASEG